MTLQLRCPGALLLLLLLVTACTTAPEPRAENEEAPEEVEDTTTLEAHTDDLIVSADWLEERLGHVDLVVLHVGNDEQDWRAGHIPGQVFVPFLDIVVGSPDEGFFLPDISELRQVFEAAGVDNQRQVVLTGDLEGLMATRAFFSLEVLGRTEGVALLDGGLTQWREQERPLADEPIEAQATTLDREASTAMILEARDVLGLLGDEDYQLVDARPGAEYRGEEPGAGVRRAGHIPSAINVFWKDSLRAEDRPLFRPVSEIEDLYREAGVDPAVTIVAYCRTGMQASFGYFLGRLIGQDVEIYDGSFVDWTKDDDRPVETRH